MLAKAHGHVMLKVFSELNFSRTNIMKDTIAHK